MTVGGKNVYLCSIKFPTEQWTLLCCMKWQLCDKKISSLTSYNLYFSFLNKTGSSIFPSAAAPPAPPQPSAATFWSPSQPPLPDSPPPPSNYPPPPPLPPGSPPPPPPPPDSDGEIMEVEMEMDDDNDGEPPAPGTEEDAGVRPPLPPGTASMKVWESWGFFFISLIVDNASCKFRLKEGCC